MIAWQTLHDVGQILEDGELDQIEIENEDLRIRMSKQGTGGVAPVASAPAGGGASPATAGGAAAPEGGGAPADWEPVVSPMVGTFYEAPAPAADPFVEVGDNVQYDTTVCIIEAMKLMNEIEAEVEGTIREVCKEDAEPVSKGDILFYVEPD